MPVHDLPPFETEEYKHLRCTSLLLKGLVIYSADPQCEYGNQKGHYHAPWEAPPAGCGYVALYIFLFRYLYTPLFLRLITSYGSQFHRCLPLCLSQAPDGRPMESVIAFCHTKKSGIPCSHLLLSICCQRRFAASAWHRCYKNVTEFYSCLASGYTII